MTPPNNKKQQVFSCSHQLLTGWHDAAQSKYTYTNDFCAHMHAHVCVWKRPTALLLLRNSNPDTLLSPVCHTGPHTSSARRPPPQPEDAALLIHSPPEQKGAFLSTRSTGLIGFCLCTCGARTHLLSSSPEADLCDPDPRLWLPSRLSPRLDHLVFSSFLLISISPPMIKQPS